MRRDVAASDVVIRRVVHPPLMPGTGSKLVSLHAVTLRWARAFSHAIAHGQ